MKQEHKDIMKQRKRNICLLVAYDGTNYHGFQRQKPPVVAVQNVLEDKLTKICGDTAELAAAGRTDAGVHATGQVVNFFTDGKIPLDRLPRAVNGLLPPDIAVLEAQEADFSFSARHSAVSKTYVYYIQTAAVRNPFSGKYAWHIPFALNAAKMQEALKLLLGKHDFSSFRAAGGADISPIRTLYRSDIVTGKNTVAFILHGNGFLYHMVRNIVGTAVSVGRGKISVADFARILDAKDRRLASPTAPPQGLFLTNVTYADLKFHRNFSDVSYFLDYRDCR